MKRRWFDRSGGGRFGCSSGGGRFGEHERRWRLWRPPFGGLERVQPRPQGSRLIHRFTRNDQRDDRDRNREEFKHPPPPGVPDRFAAGFDAKCIYLSVLPDGPSSKWSSSPWKA